MSERSKRRAREMAVIDTAVALVALNPHFYDDENIFDVIETYERLAEAVAAFSEHGLAAATATPTRYTAPKTSHEAAEWLSARVEKPLGRIFAAVLASCWGTDEGGLTADQIEQRLDLRHQTVSARVNQLRDQGYLIDSGRRRPTRSGRDAIVWTVSSLAKSAARQVPEWGWRKIEPCERST